MCLACGCSAVSDATWQARYSETRRKLWNGYASEAAKDADRYFRAAQRSSSAWSWRFRILEAEALLRDRKGKNSVDLLSGAVPANLQADLRARRGIVRGRALCYIGQDGQQDLNEAEGLINPGQKELRAELALARGNCELDRGSPGAKQFIDAAVELAHGGDPFIEAYALDVDGYILFSRDDYESAIGKLTPVLAITDSPLLKAQALLNLGASYSALGDFRRGIQASSQAADLFSPLGIESLEARALLTLGHSRAALHEFAEAKPDLLRALSIARKLRDRDTVFQCLNNLVELSLRDNDLKTAEQYWTEELATLGGKTQGNPFASFDEASIAWREGQIAKAEQLFNHVIAIAQKKPVLRSIAQTELGEIYASERKPAVAEQELRAGIQTAQEALLAVKPEYRTSFLDEHAFYDSYIQFLISENMPLRALEMTERSRANSLLESSDSKHRWDSNFDLRQLQRNLKNQHLVVLSYWVTDKESYLWAITATRCELFHLPPHRVLYDLFALNDDEIQDRREIDKSSAGQQLYEVLVKPAARLIPKGSHVIIIPSRVLCPLNFETLVVPEPERHYWIKDVQIETATSLVSLIKHPTEIHGVTKDLLLMGSPIEVDPKFPVLRYAPQEIEKVKTHFSPGRETVLAGKNATPHAYLFDDPEQYRLIHFVTHGTADEVIPMDSAIILSPDPGKSYVLFARDIVKKKINADLVTISACYGAGKRWYLSEVTVGLGWAFMRAGAHHVIAALWEVDDASSAQFMDNFYGELTRKQPVATALRDAKLALVDSNTFYRHPYYWASLQLYTGY